MNIYEDLLRLGFYEWLHEQGFEYEIPDEEDIAEFPERMLNFPITRIMHHATVFKWFRDEFSILISLDSHSKTAHIFYVKWGDSYEFSLISDIYPTFEEMEQVCIERLIKVVNVWAIDTEPHELSQGET